MRRSRIACFCICLIISPVAVRAQETIPVVPVIVPVWESDRSVYSDQRLSGTLWLTIDGTITSVPIDAEMARVPAIINFALRSSDWRATTRTAPNGTLLTIEPKDASHFDSQVSVDDTSSLTDQDGTVVKFKSKHWAFFPLSSGIDVKIRTSTSNTPIDLQKQSWIFRYDENPIATLTITKDKSNCDDAKRAVDPYATDCALQYLLARNDDGAVVVVMRVTDRGLEISHSVLDGDLHYSINGALPLDAENGPFLLPISDGDLWHVDWFKSPLGCRSYNINKQEHGNLELYEPNRPGATNLAGVKSNYITVGNAKVFDVALLQQMLNATATQLAAISGFSAGSITGAFGNLQGVTRDTSFLSAQVTTTPLPTVATSNSTGQTGNSQLVTGATAPGQTTTTVTLQCPNGSLPTLGSGNTEGCSVPPSGTTPPTTSTGTITTNGTTTPGATSQQTTGNQTSQQSGTTSTTTGVAGTVPTAPTSTAFNAPTNIGVSSADILTEQVELNAQITTLRLLLQGALSDQYVIREMRPVATRKQTTLGFAITLDPPRQFRHAVAEVRVVIVPEPGPDGVSIVNLLPAEKTYNVAKITSKQYSFGAGVAVSPVSVGVNTGKSKDRLYLAKDTDTLALQYIPPVPLPSSKVLNEIPRPFPQKLHDKFKGLIDLMGTNELADCANPGDEGEPGSEPDAASTKLITGTNATVFGWQFRPVLGEEYVRGGQRQVFAQLALPPGATSQTFAPRLYIQTRWRAYDPKRQVVGAVYTSSCSTARDLSGIAVAPVQVVKNVEMADLGGGQIKLTSTGQFDTGALSVLAGTTNIVPLASDGETLQLFGNAHDLLAADKLILLGPAGSMTPFGIRAKSDGCDIIRATLNAVPYPDGNSRLTLNLRMGREFRTDTNADGPVSPLVLIGNQVYGLKETPFTSSSCDQQHPLSCTYKFIAPTTDVRNAQTFLVKDLRWAQMAQKGTTDFFPLFSSLTAVAAPPEPTSSPCPEKVKCPPPPPPPPPAHPAPPKMTKLVVSGFNFDKLIGNAPCVPSPTTPCLNILVGSDSGKATFTPVTKNLATLDVDQDSLKKAKVIRFQLYDQIHPGTIIDDQSVEWDLPVPKPDKAPSIIATPAFLRVSDSRAVTFQGDKISSVDESSVVFDSTSPPIRAKLSADPSTPNAMILTVYVTTAITKTPGHKELTVNVKGSSPTQTLQLPIDVFK